MVRESSGKEGEREEGKIFLSSDSGVGWRGTFAGPNTDSINIRRRKLGK